MSYPWVMRLVWEDTMLKLTTPIAPVAQSEIHPCRACGTWICDDCGARRSYASRFSSVPQRCAACTRENGHMTPIIHRQSRADDHDASYRQSLAGSVVLRYPVEDAGCELTVLARKETTSRPVSGKA